MSSPMGYRETLLPHEDGQAVDQGPSKVYSASISGGHSFLQATCCRQLNPGPHDSSSQMDQRVQETTRLREHTGGLAMPCTLHGCHSQRQGKMCHCWVTEGPPRKFCSWGRVSCQLSSCKMQGDAWKCS